MPKLRLSLNNKRSIFAPFDPLITSPIFWANAENTVYSNDAGSTPSGNGDVIANAPDIGSGSHPLLQTTNGNRPTLDTTGANGRRCFYAGSASKQLATAAFTLNKPWAVTVVVKADTVTPSVNDIILDGNAVVSSAIALGDNQLFLNAGSALYYYWGVAQQEWAIITIEFNGASSKIRVNGYDAETGNAGTSNPGMIRLFGLGGANGRSIIGRVAQCIAWNSTKLTTSPTSIASLESLWGAMYGISLFSGTEKRMVFDGDSLTFGYQVANGSKFPVQVISTLGGTWRGRNFGRVNYRVDQMSADAATRIDAKYNGSLPKNICVFYGGINDIIQNGTTGNSSTTIYNSIATYCSNRRAAGWKIAVCTISDGKNFTSAPTNFETYRTAINSSIRSNWSTFADALVDLAADSRIGAADAGNNTSYFQADKLHWNASGCTVVAGLVNSAVSGLI